MDRLASARLTDQLLPVVLEAGRIEMGYFHSGVVVETKADNSPVTMADQEAEALLVAALGSLLPDCAVVAEEAYAAGARPALTEPFVLVDALDGTKQFVSGYREFTINIAIISAGRPVYGLIYAPALGDFMVTDGAHAALRASIAPNARISTLAAADPIALRVAPRQAGLVALQSRSRNFESTNAYLKAFPVGQTRLLGSSYKFCLIACGEADLYPQLGDTREWDTAAGEAILLAAGGVVTGLDGQILQYGCAATGYLNPPFIAASAAISTLRL
jgi:3'(2'), 5'-bisphosphate nucleotidase